MLNTSHVEWFEVLLQLGMLHKEIPDTFVYFGSPEKVAVGLSPRDVDVEIASTVEIYKDGTAKIYITEETGGVFSDTGVWTGLFGEESMWDALEEMGLITPKPESGDE
jgi:hypothetical protein